MTDCFNIIPAEERLMAGLTLIPTETRSPDLLWTYARAAARWMPPHDRAYAAWRVSRVEAREVVLAARAGLPLALIGRLSPLRPHEIDATMAVWRGLSETACFRDAVRMLTARVPMFLPSQIDVSHADYNRAG